MTTLNLIEFESHRAIDITNAIGELFVCVKNMLFKCNKQNVVHLGSDKYFIDDLTRQPCVLYA